METANWPKTARALLEARYKAFVDGNVDYIVESHHPETRAQLDRKALENWSKDSRWLGLTIDEEKTEKEKAHLTFTVRYEKDFETINHRELAEFRKDGDRWYYFDSEFPKPTSIKNEERQGRNEACSCGSG